jgi:hypothetical protein
MTSAFTGPDPISEHPTLLPAQPIDVTVEYRPGFYAPEHDPPGDPHPGGNANRPPEPWSHLPRASVIAGRWLGIEMTAPAVAHEVGHNFGLEPSTSPHWDGGVHSQEHYDWEYIRQQFAAR